MRNQEQYEIATKLIQEGDFVSARRLLAQILHADADDLAAWLLLSECVENDQQRNDCEAQILRLTALTEPASIANPAPFDAVELLKPGKKSHKKQPSLTQRFAWLSLALLLICLVGAGFSLFSQGLPTWASDILDEIPAAAPEEFSEITPETEILPQANAPDIEEDPPEVSLPRDENYQIHLPSMHKSQPVAAEAETVPAEEPAALDGRGDPKKWRSWPVVPFISQNAMDVYLKGIANGTDPHAFSLLGDCHSEPYIMFERFADASYIDNPDYKEYRKTLKYFHNSWNRYFITVANGMTVASAFSPAWAKHSTCKTGESPLDCEFRINNPSILLISLGTNWGGRNPDEFEKYLRKIVDYALERNVLPVIATKGDPAGPDNPLNEVMVQVAYDYDIPLWNFWSAIQDLPYHGLNPWDGLGGVHLAPEAWPIKRNTGLMALDAVRRAISGE